MKPSVLVTHPVVRTHWNSSRHVDQCTLWEKNNKVIVGERVCFPIPHKTTRCLTPPICWCQVCVVVLRCVVLMLIRWDEIIVKEFPRCPVWVSSQRSAPQVTTEHERGSISLFLFECLNFLQLTHLALEGFFGFFSCLTGFLYILFKPTVGFQLWQRTSCLHFLLKRGISILRFEEPNLQLVECLVAWSGKTSDISTTYVGIDWCWSTK